MAVPGPGGAHSQLDITAAAVVTSTSTDTAGWLFTVTVVVAGSAAGAVYDSKSTSGNSAANQIGTIPNTVGQYPFYGFPFNTGLTVAPGSGQTLTVSWT